MNYSQANKNQEDTMLGAGKRSVNPSTGKPQNFREKPCKFCGKLYIPQAPSHLYCSQTCQDTGWTSNYLKRTYGITYDDWMSLFKSQGGVCKICGSVGFYLNKNAKLKLVVDHDHTTGKVRGMLCHNCNRALGLLQDSKKNLKNALKYLEGATTISKESTQKSVEAVGDYTLCEDCPFKYDLTQCKTCRVYNQ